MLNLTVALWLLVVVYNFSDGLASPSVDNGGPGDIQHNGSFYRGHRRPPYAGYIVNGERAKKAQFPFQVRIINTKDTKTPGRSGAIITPKHVITIASEIYHFHGHCSPDNLVVQAGMIDLNELDDIEVFHAQQTICHSKYSAHPHHFNNIAIIKIQETFNMTPYVKAVKISWRLYFPGDFPVTISGWEGSNVLTFGETYIITRSECRHRGVTDTYFHPSMGCVHSYLPKGPYAYGSDFGGPMVHDGKLIGISFIPGGKNVNLFTKVAYFRKWIEDIVGKQPDVS